MDIHQPLLLTYTGSVHEHRPREFGANLADPQNWNGYGYARNNLTLFVDLDVIHARSLLDSATRTRTMDTGRRNGNRGRAGSRSGDRAAYRTNSMNMSYTCPVCGFDGSR